MSRSDITPETRKPRPLIPLSRLLAWGLIALVLGLFLGILLGRCWLAR